MSTVVTFADVRDRWVAAGGHNTLGILHWTSEKRTFHSLRHTFARIAIEHQRPIFWLSKHLGHSSLDVTANVYGHFEKATRRREAQAMAGVFGV